MRQTISREKQMKGTTARITVEIEDDGHLSVEEREQLAIALLEQGMNADYADWDDSFSVPTRNNRSI